MKPRESLELDGGAGFFELGLGLLGVFLLGLLQDSLRSAVDESLGLSQAQVGDSADGLDDLDLLVANGYDTDLKEVNAVYMEAVPWFEKAYELKKDDVNTLDFLKSICFRLRDEEGMMDKYNKYNTLLKEAKGEE